MEEEIYLKIEAYLNESMTADQKVIFESELKNNAELREEVAVHKSIDLHYNTRSWDTPNNSFNPKDKQALEAYFKSDEAIEIENKLVKARTVFTKKKKPNFFKYVLAVAAGFLLLFSLVTFYGKKSYNELFEQYYNENELPSFTTRGTQINSDFDKGINAFKKQDYKKTVTSLKEYLNQYKEANPIVYAYIGMSYLQLNQPELALTNFDKLLTSESIDAPKALWYKSLVYLKMEEKIKLEETLNLVIRHPSQYKSEAAKKMLKEIN